MTTLNFDSSNIENLEVKAPDSEFFVVNLKICHSCQHLQKSESMYHDPNMYTNSVKKPITKDVRYKCMKSKYVPIQLGRKLDDKLVFINYIPEGCDFLLEQTIDCDTIRFGKHDVNLTVEGILAQSQEILDKEEDNGSKV